MHTSHHNTALLYYASICLSTIGIISLYIYIITGTLLPYNGNSGWNNSIKACNIGQTSQEQEQGVAAMKQIIMFTLAACMIAVVITAALLAFLLYRHLRNRMKQKVYLRLPRLLERRLLNATKLTESLQSVDMLRCCALSLSESFTVLRHQLSQLPPLPSSDGHTPRILAIAREITVRDMDSADMLQAIFLDDSPAAWTEDELLAIPAAVSTACSECLNHLLLLIQQDVKEQQKAHHTARRMRRTRMPMAVLDRAELSLQGLCTLMEKLSGDRLQATYTELCKAVEDHGYTAEDIRRLAGERQTRMAEKLQQIDQALRMLRQLDWPSICEQKDPLHRMMLRDPAGIYPKLTPSSRLKLRKTAAEHAARFRTDACRLMDGILALSEEAEERTDESHIGWWLSTAQGLFTLHRRLGLHAGRICLLRIALRKHAYRLMVCAYGAAAGFLFLHFRQPVLLLPAFLLTTGSVFRQCIRSLHPAATADIAMQTERRSDSIRTLVVLHAILHSPQDAIAMLRRLKLAAQTDTGQYADFLLLGDFPPSITLYSGDDSTVITAAAESTAALCDADIPGRFLYIQRCRSRDDVHFTYAPRCGRRGAMETICRLIAQGECEDAIQYATVDLSALYRRYAYILQLDADTAPAPGMLEQLLSAAAYPLHTPLPGVHGRHGFTILTPQMRPANPDIPGCRLISPTAFLEMTDGMIPSALSNDAGLLEQMLCGSAQVPSAHAAQEQSATVSFQTMQKIQQAFGRWLTLPWQFPWVHTPDGFLRNPLSSSRRFLLRELYRETLVPVSGCVLLIWSILSGNWILLLAGLMLPVPFGGTNIDHPGWLHLLRTTLLPQETAAGLLGMYRACQRLLAKDDPYEPQLISADSWNLMAAWTQGSMAAAALAAGLLNPGMLLPGAVLCAGFAGYRFASSWLDAPHPRPQVMTQADLHALQQVALPSWKFFASHVSARTHHLPPDRIQYDPLIKSANVTSPEAIAGYMLSCIAAKEMELITADNAMQRIVLSLQQLEKLSMPSGLPCRLYHLDTGAIIDRSIDAWSCGLLTAALMTCAQAGRTWLPDCAPRLRNLPERLDRMADGMHLEALYLQEKHLFCTGLDADGHPKAVNTRYADPTLLLSFLACVRSDVPADHMRYLSRSMVGTKDGFVQLSSAGIAEDYLLPALFLPMEDSQGRRFIRCMMRQEDRGIFGAGHSGIWQFDADMNYRDADAGIAALAADGNSATDVFSPHAAALSLPFLPAEAVRCLMRMREMGSLSPEGFCDALDMSGLHPGEPPRLIGLHTAFHQALILCAAAHILADEPLRRYFCAIPSVEAALPLLHVSPERMLRAVPVRRSPLHTKTLVSPFTADPHLLPCACCVLGSPAAMAVINAQGSGFFIANGKLLTAFDPSASAVSGIQIYLFDEGRIFRLTDPLLPGETTFSGSSARFERICGSFRTVMTAVVDPANHRFLHHVEITSLTTQERTIRLTSCLLPCTTDDTEIIHGQQMLTLQDAQGKTLLVHACQTEKQPESCIACSDRAALLGAANSLRRPSVMKHSGCSYAGHDCMALQLQFHFSGRGRTELLYSTSADDHAMPDVRDFDGIAQLAALLNTALLRTVQEESPDLSCSLFLAGALLWRGYPYQCSTDHPLHEIQLAAEGIKPGQPLLIILAEESFSVPLLKEIAAAIQYIARKGRSISVCLLSCQEAAEQPAAPTAAFRDLTDVSCCFRCIADGKARDRLLASADLILRGDGPPLRQQLLSLQQRSGHIPSLPQPAPGILPVPDIRCPCGDGGFEGETNNFVLPLAAGQELPSYAGDAITCLRQYAVLIKLDEYSFNPLDDNLPRMLRIMPGMLQWTAASEQLEVTLTHALLPDQNAQICTLRFRSRCSESRTVKAAVHLPVPQGAGAAFSSGEQLAAANAPVGGWYAAAIDQEWTVQSTPAAFAFDLRGNPAWDLPASDCGDTVCLHGQWTLLPEGSIRTAWITGTAENLPAAEQIAASIRQEGAGAVLLNIRTKLAESLSHLSIQTPEDTLDLLINRILPMQLYTADSALPERAFVLAYEQPHLLEQHLLSCASDTLSSTGRLVLGIITAQCIKITGNKDLLQSMLPERSETFGTFLRHAVLDLPLDAQGLPESPNQAERCFLAAAAAEELCSIEADEALQEFRRKLLHAADTHLWQSRYFGTNEVLRLSPQSWAALSYGMNTRTKQAIDTAWDTLYVQPYGLIRQRLPDESQNNLAGSIRNSGQDTRQAVWYMQALLRLRKTENAWELLRALNPIHHADTQERSRMFRAAPWLLHGGMIAPPGQNAGQGTALHGAAAAGWLYHCVIEEMLGLVLRGDQLTLSPCVPSDWERYSFTLQRGNTTWHISMERTLEQTTVDGIVWQKPSIPLADDGKVHQIRSPFP